MQWLLFLPQLPASPSTLRVMVWRKMRANGALGLQNGVWVLPHSPEQKEFLSGLYGYLREQGASSYIFQVNSLDQPVEEDMVEKFRAERCEEYAEFGERCAALLTELEKETVKGKFTFAELEETEEELRKLQSWLEKIIARDFFGSTERAKAQKHLEKCQTANQEFNRKVYAVQGIELANEVGTDEK